MNNFKKVTKEEFDEFIKNYPRQLEKDVSGICEPPLLTYNDFSNGQVWPESVVAKVNLYESFPIYGWESNKYYISI